MVEGFNRLETKLDELPARFEQILLADRARELRAEIRGIKRVMQQIMDAIGLNNQLRINFYTEQLMKQIESLERKYDYVYDLFQEIDFAAPGAIRIDACMDIWKILFQTILHGYFFLAQLPGTKAFAIHDVRILVDKTIDNHKSLNSILRGHVQAHIDMDAILLELFFNELTFLSQHKELFAHDVYSELEQEIQQRLLTLGNQSGYESCESDESSTSSSTRARSPLASELPDTVRQSFSDTSNESFPAAASSTERFGSSPADDLLRKDSGVEESKEGSISDLEVTEGKMSRNSSFGSARSVDSGSGAVEKEHSFQSLDSEDEEEHANGLRE
jgi:hypothetical protein